MLDYARVFSFGSWDRGGSKRSRTQDPGGTGGLRCLAVCGGVPREEKPDYLVCLTTTTTCLTAAVPVPVCVCAVAFAAVAVAARFVTIAVYTRGR